MASLQKMPDVTALPLAANGTNGMGPRVAARSFLYAVFKHRWLVLGVFALVLVATAVSAFSRPGAWRASSKVLIKLGETVQLAPAEAPSRSMNLPLSQDVVRTEVDIVKSWDVVHEAVERMGIEPGEGASTADLVEGIRRALSVAPTPGTNILGISLIGRDPERVARLVNAITDVYIEHHNKVYRREGIHSFYSQELVRLERQLQEARDRLRAFTQDAGVTEINQEIRLINEQVVQRERVLKGHRQKIVGIERKLESVREQFAATPPIIDFATEYQKNPTRELYESQLAALEIKRSEAVQRYLPSDRHVADLDRQIAEIRQRLRGEQSRVLGKETHRRNTLHAELQRDIYQLETLLADARSREPLRAEAFDASQRRLEELRDKRFVLENLERDVGQKQYAYDLYWKKREEARISEAMTDQSLVDVSIVEAAQPPRTPQNGVLLPIVLGFLGGVTLAAAMAVGVEFVNGRLRFEEEVEHYLELPVLAVIPDFEHGPDLADA